MIRDFFKACEETFVLLSEIKSLSAEPAILHEADRLYRDTSFSYTRAKKKLSDAIHNPQQEGNALENIAADIMVDRETFYFVQALVQAHQQNLLQNMEKGVWVPHRLSEELEQQMLVRSFLSPYRFSPFPLSSSLHLFVSSSLLSSSLLLLLADVRLCLISSLSVSSETHDDGIAVGPSACTTTRISSSYSSAFPAAGRPDGAF